jgi:hypothetical protein
MLACSDFPTVFFWAEYREYSNVKKVFPQFQEGKFPIAW